MQNYLNANSNVKDQHKYIATIFKWVQHRKTKEGEQRINKYI